MKKLLLISMLIGAMPISMQAQDDDLYFVPKKKSSVEVVTDNYGMPKDTYYAGSDRSVDEYNRRTKSTYVEIDGDSTKVDIIDFNGQKGVYPDSLQNEDFKLTKKMTRFEGYDLTDKAAYWAGYERGRYDWGWHSPWYYRPYDWYDPWYYNTWYSGPWYSSWYGWYDPWYYGWGYPYRYGYYGYYGWRYPVVYYGGGYAHYSPRYRSPRQSFGGGRSSFGTGDRRTTAGRGSFGASYGNHRSSSSAGRTPSYNNGSFGASRSSSSSGSFGGGSRSGGGGGSFGGGGGGGRSGGGGGFGRHR